MGKIKIKNVRMRRNVAAGGAIGSLIPAGAILLLQNIQRTAFTEVVITAAFLLVVVGFPVFMLLLTRYNHTIRRYNKAKAEHVKNKRS